ncbi:MAG: hypothetical protein CL424_15760 [Acidimicrobiaceae bacterium]|nr:hypothetical protein [Acidimicrobiaceae bacterium]
MFTTGTKLLIGSAGLAWLAAAVYGVAQEGALGTIGLISAAVALSLLAGVNAFVRDSNVSATDTEAFDTSAAAQATARRSLWPLLTGIGLTMLALGMATLPAIFVLGLIALGAGLIEWLVQGWSERASADRAFNDQAREVVADPLELPVAGAILFAIIVYAFSRVMLGMSTKSATVVVFSVVAAIILALGVLVALKRRISVPVVTGVFSIGLLAIVAGGAIAGLNGERDIEVHETTADLAEANRCGTEETEADSHASQTVAAKSNPAATLIYDGSELEIDEVGDDGQVGTITLPRSNPTNVMFLNESEGEARLVLELHPAVDADGVAAGPERICTTLVEDGGRQIMTVEFDRPSFALEAEGVNYEFVVAGSDAAVEVIVP